VITGSARWYTVGARIVTAVRTGLSSSVARAGQVPGDIAWDECSCDGALYVTVPRVYLSEAFPAEQETPVGARCRAPYEVGEYTVSVVRCAPQPDGQDIAPFAADLDNAAGLLLQDIAETMDALAVLMCSMDDADEISDYLVTPAESAGPNGDCVGFTLRVLVALERP
jgi:hypothetical protein